MKKGVRVALLTGVTLFGVGTVLALTGLVFGGSTSITYREGAWEAVSFLPEATNDHFVATIGGTEKVSTGKVTLEPFDKLEIQTCAVDVQVVASDSYGIELRYQSNHKIAYGIKDGKLMIEQDHIGSHQQMKKKEGVVTIYVPEDVVLEDAVMTAGMGDISYPKVALDTLQVDLGMGEVKLKGTTVKNLKVDNGMGDIILIGVTSYETELSLGMGEARLEGQFEGDIVIENGMGDIEVTTTRPYDFYNYDLSKGMGSIYLNNHKYGMGQDVEERNGADYTIELSAGMGDIKVTTNK